MSKVALVVGNSKYREGDDVSGVEDAKAMAACLNRLGFQVQPPVLDASLKTFRKALADFQKKIVNAQVVVFFYSGHGFQNAGQNYLLPTDGTGPRNSLPLTEAIRVLGAAPVAALKFAFLDACRDVRRFLPNTPPGLAEAPGAAVNVLQAFAATPGQVAASGSRDGLSPYTTALLRYLPEPGLELDEFFDKVAKDVFRDSPQQQQPVLAGALPAGFFFRAPVVVNAVIPDPQSDLLAFLDGKIVLSTGNPIQVPLRLKARDNPLVLMVSSNKSFRNNHDWDISEGWSYRLNLELPGGRTQIFEGREDHPFKVGPRHGRVFEVASVNLYVDPQTSEVSLKNLENLVDKDIPFFARDQELLFEASITDLNLSPDEILGDVIGTDGIAAILRPFLIEFLRTGTVLGTTIANPARTFVTVWGNRALRGLAQGCMARRDDRIRDLKASIAAVFNRHPTPFVSFDQGLTVCMRSAAEVQGSALPPEDIAIWTALHDRSNETPGQPT